MYNGEERYDIFEFEDRVFMPTPAQASLLKALVEAPPDVRKVEDILEMANICKVTYYKFMNDPDFKRAYFSVLMNSLTTKASKVIDAVFEYGTNNKACHADRKLMLEMLGMYEKKSKVDITQKKMSVNVSMQKATTDDLKKMLKELLKTDPELLEGLKDEI